MASQERLSLPWPVHSSELRVGLLELLQEQRVMASLARPLLRLRREPERLVWPLLELQRLAALSQLEPVPRPLAMVPTPSRTPRAAWPY